MTFPDTVVLVPGSSLGLHARLQAFDVDMIAAELGSCWDGLDHLLTLAERPALDHAAPKRRREIIAGRLLAHELLRRLGPGAIEVPRQQDRSPAWPHGVVGSITHTDTICAVALGTNDALFALGLDLEPRVPLDKDLWRFLCRPEELDQVRQSANPGLRVRQLFCAKEAYYKAQFPHTGRFLEHQDIGVRFDDAKKTFSVAYAEPLEIGESEQRCLSGTGLLSTTGDLLGAAWVVRSSDA